MSDNSNSTGSTGSSTNSWTLLSPEEVAIENVGPVDDGTESLGDVPSLAEEVAGAAAEFKPPEIPVETVLSEEGHQVCQETSPESSEGPIPSSPSRLSPIPPNPSDLPDLDLESQAPVIHDMVTSSPSDNEHLCAMPFVTNIDLRPSLDVPPVEDPQLESEESGDAPHLTEVSPEDLVLDTPDDSVQTLTGPPEESLHAFSVEPDVKIAAETLTTANVEADVSFVPEITEPLSAVAESPATEPADESTVPEPVGSSELEEPVEEQQQEEEEEEEEEASVEAELTEPVTQDESEHIEEPSGDFANFGDTSGFEEGLRRRTGPQFEAARPRTSDEEDEEEEVEFKLAEKKEEKPWLSLNKCIVGALVLLFLGSLFLSGDFDASDLSDGEQSQDWLSGDPQDMKELLDKLTQENQQITQLEAQLQSQKEELDSALKAVAASGDEQGKADLEKENTKLKEELSSLPQLKTELESLRARVTELSQLKADQEILPIAAPADPQPDDKDAPSHQKAAGPQRREDSPDGGGRLKEELRRQKGLLEESKKRLQMMKKDGGGRKQVRDHLEQIQKKLSEQVDRWEKKKEHKWKESKGKEHWKQQKEEKKEWRGEKERKDGGRRDKEEEEKKEWKSERQNSHKEAWRKHQDEWERKKDQRKSDREERRKEKPWHSRPDKHAHGDRHHHHHHHHQHHQHHHHDDDRSHQHQHQHQHQQPPPQRQNHRQHHDFWRDQEQKLQRNVKPQAGCASVEECAALEGLYPVELPEFEELLEGYLSKLEGSSPESKDKLARLTADFFEGGVFIHDRVSFADFAEDVADVLEDMVDVLEDDDALEEEMEEFEREALWKFAATP
ncbi:unnamed protein product [Ophioblennius macclurei]